jgi:hypothetical protein
VCVCIRIESHFKRDFSDEKHNNILLSRLIKSQAPI